MLMILFMPAYHFACESFLCSSFKICILIIALRGKGQQNWYMSLVYPLVVVHCIVHVYMLIISLPTIKIGENLLCGKYLLCIVCKLLHAKIVLKSEKAMLVYVSLAGGRSISGSIPLKHKQCRTASTTRAATGWEFAVHYLLNSAEKKVLLRGIGHNNDGVSLVVDPFTESMLLIIFLSTKPAANTSITNNNQKQKKKNSKKSLINNLKKEIQSKLSHPLFVSRDSYGCTWWFSLIGSI
jgi:hypothetical protein